MLGLGETEREARQIQESQLVWEGHEPGCLAVHLESIWATEGVSTDRCHTLAMCLTKVDKGSGAQGTKQARHMRQEIYSFKWLSSGCLSAEYPCDSLTWTIFREGTPDSPIKRPTLLNFGEP